MFMIYFEDFVPVGDVYIYYLYVANSQKICFSARPGRFVQVHYDNNENYNLSDLCILFVSFQLVAL